MSTYKEICENVLNGWIVYTETDDDTQLMEHLQAWALKNAYTARDSGVCRSCDVDDLTQEYLVEFLEFWDGKAQYLGFTLKTVVSNVNRRFNPAGAVMEVPVRWGNRNLPNRGAHMPEMSPVSYNPETMDQAEECEGLRLVELQDEVDAVKKAFKGTELESVWKACLELGGDPVAIRREYGDYKGNKMLEDMRKYLTSKTNIVEPKTVGGSDG